MSVTSTGSLPQVPQKSPEAPAQVGETTPDLAPQRVRTLLAVLIVSAFAVILNETVLSVALPDLMADLHVPATTAQWLTAGFMLTMAVVIPTTGFLLERLPHRVVFMTAMVLFTAGTVLASMAPNFPVLMTARVVQASGTALLLPLLMTTVLTVVPAERRGSLMGLISVVISVAPAVGPTISGIILGALSWRWLFLIMLPIAVAALVIGAWLMPSMGEPRKVRLDLLSVVLSVLGFGGLVMGLSGFGSHGSGAGESGGSVPPVPALVVGLIALSLFVWRQVRLQREDRALLDLRPFTHRTFTISLGMMIVAMGTLFGIVILLPIYMQSILGHSTLTTGLSMLPGGLIMGLLAPFVGRLYDRHGAKVLVIPGAFVLSAALWSFAALGADAPLWRIVASHIVMSSGLALLFTPLMTSALGSLPQSLYSHGSAVMNTLQQVAGAAGSALFITLMALGTASAMSGGADQTAGQAHGIHVAFLVSAAISLVTIVFAFFVPKRAEGSSARHEV
ncbi:DHA2 family efflux MFS transporter permease subunit [Kocuria soli]|uniref:DHA2 family efflux MFS transporter permease subunit n=1 Tax=Kocuria soli TaxID=2485125 RepID=A0A3N3ZSD7_9MICC|nr:MDR family MFS transporter [Kocuria soli]ROZ64366.1 DHA2 family efflux MFS transporter permease subunit [Kocuria soli]